MYKGYKMREALEDLRECQYIGKGKMYYLDRYICLDTETSWNHEEENPECWVYQWAACFNECLYYGRKPAEIVDFLNEFTDFYGTDDTHRIIVFVHNLSYDFSYLLGYFFEAWGNPRILGTSSHKVFNVAYNNGIELRCTYKLSNDSLERWGRKLDIKHKKQKGLVDYMLIRNQDSILYYDDWKYMLYDVISMNECIEKQLAIYGDTLVSMPLTSTGYIRREFLRSHRGGEKGKHRKENTNRRKFIETRLFRDTYISCFSEFAGGITHGNRFLQAETVEGDIRHRDFRSHYPSQLRVRKYPIEKFIKISNGGCGFDSLKKYQECFFLLIDCILSDISLKDEKIPIPYLQSFKLRQKRDSGFTILDDNGRAIKTTGQTHVTLTYEEFSLISEQYHFQYYIKCVWGAKKDYLPEWVTTVLDQAFRGKTEYKDACRKAAEEGKEDSILHQLELDLMKSKNSLNGAYGCMATNPIREEIILNGLEWSTKRIDFDNLEEELDKFYNRRNSCLRYQWGIAVTMYARIELMEYISLIDRIGRIEEGIENVVLYVDTDSIFYISTPKIEEAVENLNRKKEDHARSINARIVTNAGKELLYDCFELEKENIRKFRYLHSKCYCYERDDGSLKLTVAGVREYGEGGLKREKELKYIENLKEGFTFRKCGGSMAIYNEHERRTYHGNDTCGGCIIKPREYTLNMKDYLYEEEMYYRMLKGEIE